MNTSTPPQKFAGGQVVYSKETHPAHKVDPPSVTMLRIILYDCITMGWVSTRVADCLHRQIACPLPLTKND